MAFRVPNGFQLTGVFSGVKTLPGKLDLTLITCDAPSVAAGVYTKNLVCAAPVVLDRSRTPSDRIRAVVINSGNANACTGERGLRDAETMARLAADTCGADADQALVLSTGIIGEYLPMEKIEQGIRDAADKLGSDADSLDAAARGMLTTDTVVKIASRTLSLTSGEVTLTGMAKGAAMIGPNMATMLGVVLTDAVLEPDVAQSMLSEATDKSFNCISVDGHTSTNDSVLLVASGRTALAGDDLAAFARALEEVCVELARSIPADGEGASHLVTIEITGCCDTASARQIAKTVADSPLVKTAVAGADPNWGRIVSAAGYADVPFDPKGVGLHVNGFELYRNGAPTTFDAQAVSDSIRDNRDTRIQLTFVDGDAEARFWTTDLTAEYVRLNADYHT